MYAYATQANQQEKMISGAVAAGMHLLFIALLVFGVNWQRHVEQPVNIVDLWTMPTPAAEAPVAPPKPTFSIQTVQITPLNLVTRPPATPPSPGANETPKPETPIVVATPIVPPAPKIEATIPPAPPAPPLPTVKIAEPKIAEPKIAEPVVVKPAPSPIVIAPSLPVVPTPTPPDPSLRRYP